MAWERLSMYGEMLTGGKRRRWVSHLLTGSAAGEQTFLTRVLSVLSMVDIDSRLLLGQVMRQCPFQDGIPVKASASK